MMTLREPSGEFTNGQLLFDAYAMSKRTLDEAQRTQQLALEYSGQAYTPLIEGLKELIAATGAYQLIDLIEGYPPRTTEQYLEEVGNGLSDGALSQFILEDADAPEGLDGAALRDFFLATSNNLKDFIGQGSAVNVDEELLLYHKAEELRVAKNNGTTVEAIFKDDESYAELIRYAFSPEEMAKRQLDTTEKFTLKTVSDSIINS
jgi:hypothetical protein